MIPPGSNADFLRELAARIDAAPSVARRSSGLIGTVAAYLPGERIEGIRIQNGRPVAIHVVMKWPATVDQVETDVLEALGGAWGTQTVDIVIDDIQIPGETATEGTRTQTLPPARAQRST